ncbi:MAG: AAA family ATPase [Rhodocyclaceae bacterium]|jgi:MSHA biogenesis protein MshM|nr:AAA family ATPase [Rhodocyclaceae bacterium]
MYLPFFGLNEFPFGITPDTSFLFAAAGHEEALNTLRLAVSGGEGFVKVTGEVGTGKTLLCRRFLASLGAETVTAYLPNPMLEPRTLLLAIAEELNIPLEKYDYQFHLLKYFNQALMQSAAEGKRVLVCIDEAQAMPLDTLESLRLLSNLETEKRKLMQVVMFGQPELDVKLADPAVRQLRQRIGFEYRLRGLDRREVEHYVAHRLRVAGHRGTSPVFSAAALRALHSASGGTPRVVNILAHKSLLSAFGEGKEQVGLRHAMQAVRDSAGIVKPLGGWWRLAA